MTDDTWERAQERKRAQAQRMTILRTHLASLEPAAIVTLERLQAAGIAVDSSTAADLNALCVRKRPLLTKDRRGGHGEVAQWRRTSWSVS